MITNPDILSLYGASKYVAPLRPGAITIEQVSSDGFEVSAVDASGGVGDYIYQYATRPAGTGTYVNATLTTIDGILTGLSPGTDYDLQLTYKDSAGSTVTAELLYVKTAGDAAIDGEEQRPICT